MTPTEQKQYINLPFSDYLKLTGFSFSGLRNPDGFTNTPTTKMRFGSLVDDYIFTPAAYTGEQRDLVIPVAKAIKSVLGDAINYGQPQLSVTANFNFEGFTMPYRGRLDLYLKGIVIDLKVSELDPRKAIEFFRYDWQLSGYAMATGAKKCILCSINPKTKKVSLIPINVTTDWWEYQIKVYGKSNVQ